MIKRYERVVKRYERVGRDFVAVDDQDRVVGIIRPFEGGDRKVLPLKRPSLPPELMFKSFRGPDDDGPNDAA
jgi:hypothetical protein